MTLSTNTSCAWLGRALRVTSLGSMTTTGKVDGVLSAALWEYLWRHHRPTQSCVDPCAGSTGSAYALKIMRKIAGVTLEATHWWSCGRQCPEMISQHAASAVMP